MKTAERARRLDAMLRQVAADRGLDLESLARSNAVSMVEGLEADGENVRAQRGLEKLATGHVEEVEPAEVAGLEAIVMVQYRPVAYIRDGVYDAVEDPWTALNDDKVRARIQPAIASIGRVELPTNPRIPYGGTGFVVGAGLVMTNRHVARLFADGLGTGTLKFTPGDAGIDFNREIGTELTDESRLLTVRKVEMIHPYWDMALLRVDGLPSGRPALRLSVRPPEDLQGSDVVVVGYPARDDRNDLGVQDRIFQRTYHVKRFQPGKIRARVRVQSFESIVPALTHDSSTLGGNSGSAVLDVATGEVVGLHFAGEYLAANYAVPTYDLARDGRVAALGLGFTGAVTPTGDCDDAWRRAEPTEAQRVTVQVPSAVTPAAAPAAGASAVTWTIPIQVTISVGQPTPSGGAPSVGSDGR